MMMSGRSSSKYPFTPSQWQELEHQALIYKYMDSGMPIPSDLILPIRRSFLLDSTTMAVASPSLAFPPQPPVSWGCFQLGFGRRAEDPEPGRCRRTDGKKWRCSKEAYPDSKYCERHMHRGKNRSRKPVEMSFLPTATTITTPTIPSSPSSSSFSSQFNSLYPPPPPPPSLSISTPEAHLNHMYPNSSSPKPQAGTLHFHLETPIYPTSADHKDYRYYERENSWQFRQLGMSSQQRDEQHGASAVQQNTCSHCTINLFKQEEEGKEHQHCFVLGADLKLEKPVTTEKQQNTLKPLRCFFDEWPQKSKASWMDMEGDQMSLSSYSTTHLSISTPMAQHHEWFAFFSLEKYILSVPYFPSHHPIFSIFFCCR